MFSLQTRFGKGDGFFSLLEASADAGLDATRALLTLVERRSRDLFSG